MTLIVICPFFASASRDQKQPWERQQHRTIGQCRIGLLNGRQILIQILLALKVSQERGTISSASSEEGSNTVKTSDHFLLRTQENAMCMSAQDKEHSGKTILLVTDQGESVLAQLSQGDVSPMAHTAYGHLSATRFPSTALGFNGEFGEPHTRWYLLGNGHRAYNPLLMRFHSPDKLSPFKAGGLNAYMYCAADPINQKDPTGRVAVPFVNGVMMVTGSGASVSGISFTLISNGRFTRRGIATLSMGVAGLLLTAAAVVTPVSVIAYTLAAASAAAGLESMRRGYVAVRAMVTGTPAGGARQLQRRASFVDQPPRYSLVSGNVPPSFSSLDLTSPSSLDLPPPYSPPSIAPTHSTTGGSSQAASSNGPKRVTARRSSLPTLQIIDETSFSKQIRDP
jgi:RHS repeat-associated protein